MIKIRNRKINILDDSIITTFVNIGRFEYEVDLNNQVINIHPKKAPFFRLFDKYYDVIEECTKNIILSYIYHKNNDSKIIIESKNYNQARNKKTTINKTFLDEIHFVGLMYVEKIEIKSSDEMYNIVLKLKSRFLDEDTKKEYRHEEDNPFGIFKRNYQDNALMRDDWWIRKDINNKNDPFQITEAKPTIVELLGCFVKEEHAIYICDKNIKKTTKMISKDKWFENEIKTFTKLVVLHEIGHSVFQYIGFDNKQPIINETRANYFSSLMTYGEFDYYINEFTSYQPFEYHFPFLSLHYMIYERRYMTTNPYLDTINCYNKVLIGDIYGLSI